jgi:dienelactone hydrolase
MLGGADYLRSNGAERVIAGGASIGAMASLHAAEQPSSNLDGVIWLAGVLRGSGYSFQEADVTAVACPMLFISGDEDTYGAADAAQQLHDWAPSASRLLIVDSRLHGTDILDEDDRNAAALTQAMFGFVDQVANESSAC